MSTLAEENCCSAAVKKNQAAWSEAKRNQKELYKLLSAKKKTSAKPLNINLVYCFFIKKTKRFDEK